jgi:hypothetical protein
MSEVRYWLEWSDADIVSERVLHQSKPKLEVILKMKLDVKTEAFPLCCKHIEYVKLFHTSLIACTFISAGAGVPPLNGRLSFVQ